MAMLKIIAYNLTHNQKYINALQGDVDYLLGRNATAYCFVTGFGQKRVMNIHHRPSGADGIEDPCPGFLVGGPNTVVLNDCPSVQRSTKPAKSFVDLLCSYSTNEIAINWNAPLFFVLGALDSVSK
jgi:endoglucanase